LALRLALTATYGEFVAALNHPGIAPTRLGGFQAAYSVTRPVRRCVTETI